MTESLAFEVLQTGITEEHHRACKKPTHNTIFESARNILAGRKVSLMSIHSMTMDFSKLNPERMQYVNELRNAMIGVLKMMLKQQLAHKGRPILTVNHPDCYELIRTYTGTWNRLKHVLRLHDLLDILRNTSIEELPTLKIPIETVFGGHLCELLFQTNATEYGRAMRAMLVYSPAPPAPCLIKPAKLAPPATLTVEDIGASFALCARTLSHYYGSIPVVPKGIDAVGPWSPIKTTQWDTCIEWFRKWKSGDYGLHVAIFQEIWDHKRDRKTSHKVYVALYTRVIENGMILYRLCE